ncbi:nuclease harbi1 [Lasius niger]|uniref:Nuclease harbi1 n=1 Tax=Lasius niger TaxID=67767 RepID=A0A0J7KD22_LASNI|nr:nuclease harbi1 [Lasius niger]
MRRNSITSRLLKHAISLSACLEWKRRFPILALDSRFSKVQRVLPVIVATAILHNIARRAGDPLPPDDPALQLPVPWEEILEHGNVPLMNDASGNDHMQNILINDYFRR